MILAVLVVAGLPNDATAPAAPAGWTLRSSVIQNAGSNDVRIMTFYRLLVGGDANPSVTLPAAWTGGTAGMSGQIAAWRGVDAATPFDATDTTGTSNSSDGLRRAFDHDCDGRCGCGVGCRDER